ncbi:MAG: endonuclease III [Phycisphaerales bacterium]
MAQKKSAPAADAAPKSPKKAFKHDKAAAAERVGQIYPILKKTYPHAGIALTFGNPLELLIATILSAQCTDARVNMVTPGLFKKYRSATDWAQADIKEIEQDIKSCGFYHNKAVSIQGASKRILEDFGGEVPKTMDELVTLPGVGRKTANCVIGNAYGRPAIMCDTHVIRLSRRLQLSPNSDPVKLEFDLADIVPKDEWTLFCHLLITHGRAVCKARKPDCPACPIAKHCPAANNPKLW